MHRISVRVSVLGEREAPAGDRGRTQRLAQVRFDPERGKPHKHSIWYIHRSLVVSSYCIPNSIFAAVFRFHSEFLRVSAPIAY